METKMLSIGLVVMVISLLIAGIPVSASSSDILEKSETCDEPSETGRPDVTVTSVTPSSDELLGKYEKSDRFFKKSASNRTITYVHQRRIDDVEVRGDHIIYVFDKNTELIEKDIRWRDDLPKHMPPVIFKEQAESIADGGSATLYFLSTNRSFISPKPPAPINPCWVVWKAIKADKYGTHYNIIIVDAVKGEIIGYGIPPPATGFSVSGPQNVSNCSGVWTELYQNAESWFNTMGYPTEAVVYPNEAKIKSHIQSYETVMFYEIAHSVGGSSAFRNNCTDTTTADEIHNWIKDYPKMPFTFLASCNGTCDMGLGTLSYEFRKGSTDDTVTIGYCGMNETPCNQTCWYDDALDWQDALFNYMNQGWTVKDAFDQACYSYPGCYNETAGIRCVRFAGDENFKVVPKIGRVSLGEAVR